ncbi:hypothetical protein [Bacillus pumilus]|uniref:hypothetical protein n=1 Tax=Bacillus pumilus TaxID=1408 RepID=UPI0024935C3B|nr:hypothetical protein [Bacillus pumilus]
MYKISGSIPDDVPFQFEHTHPPYQSPHSWIPKLYHPIPKLKMKTQQTWQTNRLLTAFVFSFCLQIIGLVLHCIGSPFRRLLRLQ